MKFTKGKMDETLMPKAWKHHKDKAEYLTMFWLKFEDDTPKNVVSVSFYLKKKSLGVLFKKAIWSLQMDTW